MIRLRSLVCGLLLLALFTSRAVAQHKADHSYPLFSYLTSKDEPARLICYTPSELDPRVEANQGGHH